MSDKPPDKMSLKVCIIRLILVGLFTVAFVGYAMTLILPESWLEWMKGNL